MPKRTSAEEIEKLDELVSKTKPRVEMKSKEEPEPKPPIDPALLRRGKPKREEEPKPEPPPLTSGTIDKIVDLALNPSRETIRGFTNIDRIQGKLLPQLDIIDLVWQNVIETAMFRQDAVEYERVYKHKRPISLNLIDEFTYRTAQWQKSVQGKSLQSAIDLALAETETRNGDERDILDGHGNFED